MQVGTIVGSGVGVKVGSVVGVVGLNEGWVGKDVGVGAVVGVSVGGGFIENVGEIDKCTKIRKRKKTNPFIYLDVE